MDLHGTHEYEATREQEDYWPYLMDVLARRRSGRDRVSEDEPPRGILNGSERSVDADGRETGEDLWGVKVLRVFGQERFFRGRKVIGVVKDRLEDQVVRRITDEHIAHGTMDDGMWYEFMTRAGC